MNKKIMKKIALVLICIIIFNLTIPFNESNAGFTGILTKPITWLCMGILDAVNGGLTLLLCGFTAMEEMADEFDSGEPLSESVHDHLIAPDRIFARRSCNGKCKYFFCF